jgi:hypothetical protein
MAFGHSALATWRGKPGAAFATPGSADRARRSCAYFGASPPNVSFMPLRKLNGNAGNPGAGS